MRPESDAVLRPVEVTSVRPSLANASPAHSRSSGNSPTICRVAAFQSRKVFCSLPEAGTLTLVKASRGFSR